MLHLPPGGSSIAKVIGIDPGSETLGVGIMSFDTVSQAILRTDAFTVFGSKLGGNEWLGFLHGDRFQRIAQLSQNLTHLFRQEVPLAIAVESPFFNHLRPQAYGVLMEVMAAIRQAVWDYDPWHELYLIDPSSVKKAAGVLGNANKDTMREAIRILSPQLHLTCDVDLLDEHSIDAVAVAYCRYKRLFGV